MRQDTPKPTSSQGESLLRPIWNEDAEKAVLSCCVNDPAISIPLVRSRLSPEDLYSALNRKILEVIFSLWQRGDGVDPYIVAAEMEVRGLMPQVEAGKAINEITQAQPVCVHADFYAKLVAEKAFRRKTAAAAMAVLEACHNGADPAECAARLSGIRRVGTIDEAMARAVLTHEQLQQAELPPLEPILGNGLLARCDYGLLFGPKGTGKSWLALQLAVCVADGSPFMGWPTTRDHVLVFSFELTRDRLRSRIEAIAGGRVVKGLYLYGKDSLAGISGAEGLSPIPRLARQADQERILRLVSTIGPGLVVIDPLGPTVGSTEKEELEAIASFIMQLAAKTRCAILVTHHPRKPSNQGPKNTNSHDVSEARGAGQLGDWASCVLHVKKKDGLYLLTHGAEPRHCTQPDDVWMHRTKTGPLVLTDAPERRAEEEGLRLEELRGEMQRRGSLARVDIERLMGVNADKARQYAHSLGFRQSGGGRSTIYRPPIVGFYDGNDAPTNDANGQ